MLYCINGSMECTTTPAEKLTALHAGYIYDLFTDTVDGNYCEAVVSVHIPVYDIPFYMLLV
jgi:hypothetical protein